MLEVSLKYLVIFNYPAHIYEWLMKPDGSFVCMAEAWWWLCPRGLAGEPVVLSWNPLCPGGQIFLRGRLCSAPPGSVLDVSILGMKGRGAVDRAQSAAPTPSPF